MLKFKTFFIAVNLFLQGKTLGDKKKILGYFLRSLISNKGLQIKPLILNYRGFKVNIRKNKPNDLYSAYKYSGNSIYKSIKNRKFTTSIDIGANIGLITMIMSKVSGKVISFEPESENYRALEENVKLNQIRNVNQYQLALSDKDEETYFYINNKNEGGHTINKEQVGRFRDSFQEKRKIFVVKLDSFLKKKEFGKIDLIKIDVEGAELDVLNGAKETIMKDKPLIIFEALDEKELTKSRQFLKRLGYTIKDIGSSNYLAKPI